MRKRLAAWIIIILFALILYLFSNESVTLALLISVIIAVPVSLLMLRLTYRNFEAGLSDAETSYGKYSFVLNLRNNGILPIASVETEVRCTNLRTGESDIYTVRRGIGPRGEREITMDVYPSHAGRYLLSVSSARITDPLGIAKRDISCGDSRGITVMPEVFNMNVITSSSAAMPESEGQALKAKGSVAGDVTGIREYVPGDPVRNIHWKLSEKTDRMLVRELGNPVLDEFLIVMDNSLDIAQDPVALDAVAAVYTSLIHSLVQRDSTVSAGWTDPDTGRAVIRMLRNEDDARSAADEYLAVPALMPSAFRRIERDVAEDRYAHIVIVGSRIPESIDNISNGCQLTVLMYGGSRSFSEKNMNVIGFDADSYIMDTAGIEV